MPRLILISFFVVSISITFAQTGFRPGFLVTHEGDTIAGEIAYQSNTKHHEVCRFRKDNHVTEYTPHTLAGYGFVNDKHFTADVVDGVFVEVLVRGELSLYKYLGKYFVRKLGDQVHELESRESTGYVDGKPVVKKDIKWKGTIIYLTADCRPQQAAIEALALDDRRLSTLVSKYNKCKGTRFIVYKEGKPWARAEVGLLLGVTQTSINVAYADGFPYLADHYTSLDPSFGMTVSISSPRISEKIGLQSGINFTRSAYASHVVINNPTNTAYYDTRFNLTTLSVPFLLRYSFIQRKYSLQMLAGINSTRHTKSDSKAHCEFVSGDGEITVNDIEGFRMRRSQTGYGGGLNVGRSFRNIKTSLAATYFYMGPLNERDRLDARTSRLSLSLVISTK